mmetsp:Transcript_3518/g.7319  ORF Transcript_3518/g.7319 Transcript_3518/m.7319 type:complete len:114 (-) Transcript_3518:3794-4135(-)
MKYLAAYALAVLGGKEAPSKADLSNILSAVDADFDEDRADALVSKLHGKALHEVISSALSKLQSVSVSAAAPSASASAAPTAAAAKEEKPKEKEEEEEEAGGAMDLFGGGDDW